MQEKILLKWATQKQLTVPTLLLQHYAEMGLKENELIALLQVQTYIEAGNQFPTPDLISERMTLTASECAELLGRLVRRGFLALERKSDEQGIVYECYSLEPLWIKLIELLKGETLRAREEDQHEQEGQLFKRFEEEFGRPLSPIEAETLSMWLDEDRHSPTLIVAALREAVVSGKVNFRYIDRILFEWKRNGVTSLEQAKLHGEKFRKYNQVKKQEKPRAGADSYPGFSWLEQR
ncbi:DnaD domain-containing protein [Halalkalibacter oceani]|uniref:DnaD domain-containing protein n=1 Tax=Halalkalibacter oceani TaxID=1653776 RepID=UPI0033914826